MWRSERADGLLEPLAALLGEPPADPFTREVVAVPTAGIERWLAQELSLRLGTGPSTTDGVCANVEFAFPGRLVAAAMEAAGGLPEGGDVWRPERLVWPLLSLADADPGASWLGPAAPHLASGDDGRRFSAARRIADLFDRYAVHRPQMVRAWAQGEDLGPDLGPVPAAHAWQPTLWRRLRTRLDTPSTAERLVEATDRLAAGEVELDLPGRLSVFGLTALPASYLRLLGSIAAVREVHLFLLHPSPALWDRVEATLADHPSPPGPREDDATRSLPRHPLLGSWGRDAREMQVVFHALDAVPAVHRAPAEAAGGTLLARLQADIRADREPPGPPVEGSEDRRVPLEAGDRSVQVHACHGRTRQVQVLRDAVLHLLERHEDLEPRDIIVMCPDVETFAPLVDAVFGAEVDRDEDGAPAMRVRLADRSLRQTNPVLTVVAELLEVADARLTGSEVLDLLGRAPVRRRFSFDDDDLERLETWVPELGIRWGFDAGDRERFDLGDVAANTWRFGLQRLLTGVAMADEELRLVEDTVPYDDVEGSDVELAGRFAECLARLEAVCTGLRTARSVEGWRDVLVDAADQLTATAPAESWQRAQLHRLLDDVVDEAATEPSEGGGAGELHLAEIRVLLGDRLRGRPTRASHRTGDLTVSTLVPMRAVPHRVVCLLGMDDGSFPRRTVGDGDDLVDLVPFVGDRDPRTEDRQLLLDALLSATDHLVITYSGHDERTNEPLPPAVPVGELLDVVDATARVPAEGEDDGPQPDANGRPRRARQLLVVEHPLQSFDPRNYLAGSLGETGPFSFDGVGLAGARARADGAGDPPAFLSRPLGPREDDRDVVDLGQLVRFLEHPTRAFLGERLGVWFPSEGDGPQDGIPLDLTGLPQWQVGDRLLTALREGHSREQWERVERARGTLPPEPLGERLLEQVCPVVEEIVAAADDLLGRSSARPVELDVALVDRRRLVGTVTGVVDDAVAHVAYSRLKARTRLGAYARLVALSAHDPDTPWQAVLVGRAGGQGKKQVEWCRLGPLGETATQRAEEATRRLATLIDLYDRGMREPAPLYGDTSEAIARNLLAGKTAWHAAGSWETSWGRFSNDDLDPCHVTVLGRVATFAELLETPPDPDELGEDWPECEERIVAWARRLWEPVVEIEDGGRR